MSDEQVLAAEEYDATETLKPGERVFAVQFGDPFGPATANFWGSQARAAGLEEKDPAKREKLLIKATMAETVACEMQEYQKGHAPVEALRASYNDQAAATVDFGDQVKARKALIANVAALHNAAGIAKAVEEALCHDHPDEREAIRRAIRDLNKAAAAIDPRHGNERT